MQWSEVETQEAMQWLRRANDRGMVIRISAVIGVTFSLFLMLNTFKCYLLQIEIPMLRIAATSIPQKPKGFRGPLRFDCGHSPSAQDDTLCYFYQIEIPISLRSIAATSIPQKPKGFRGPLRFDCGHSPSAQDDTLGTLKFFI